MKRIIGQCMRVTIIALAVLQLTSCKRDLNLPWDSPGKTPVKKIYVYSTGELYAAVNDSSNENCQVVLAPGTYTLAANYPNAGRLELQLDMKLIGQAGQRDRVTIDASQLPASSFLLPLTAFRAALRTGAIRTGKGTNAIEWLTLIGNDNMSALSMIETDLTTTPTTQLLVANNIIRKGRMGIDIRNRDLESNNRIVEAEIRDNEISGLALSFGIGIAFQNSRDVRNAVIRAKLANNYIHGNMIGIASYNVVCFQSRIEVKSENDRMIDNGLGLSLAGSVNEYPDLTSNNNIVKMEARGTVIINNNGLPRPDSPRFVPGGVTLTGAQLSPTSAPGTINNNTVSLIMWDCRIENNLPPYDITAIGARSTHTSPLPAGTNNNVIVELHGTSALAKVNAIESVPAEPAGTNKVFVYR